MNSIKATPKLLSNCFVSIRDDKSCVVLDKVHVPIESQHILFELLCNEFTIILLSKKLPCLILYLHNIYSLFISEYFQCLYSVL